MLWRIGIQLSNRRLRKPNSSVVLAAPKLCVTSRIFLPEASAASFRLGAVCAAAVENNWLVRVLTTKFAGVGTQKEGNMVISRFPALRDRSGYLRGYLPYMSFDFPLFFRLLFTHRPDVALVEPPPTTGVVARMVCSGRRIPYVWYAADIWSDATEAASASKLIVNVVRRMERFSLRGASAVVAVSEGVADRAKELGAKNVTVVPNGIDTDMYDPGMAPASSVELADMGITLPYVIYAGTASEWQKAEVFAEALLGSPDLADKLQMVFVGNGSSWRHLEELQETARTKFGRDVLVLLDQREAADIVPLLRGAKAALVSIAPDIGYNFAYPTKVLAALAAGIPVIYAGVGPARTDITSNGFGFTVPFKKNEIVKALRAVADGSFGWGKKDGERAAHWVNENRSLRATGESVVQVLNTVYRGKATHQ